jgi:hypothetical protein
VIPSTADILRAVADAARHSEGVGGVLMALPFALRIEQAAEEAEKRDIPSERVVPWVEPRSERARHVDPAFSEGHANLAPRFFVAVKKPHQPDSEEPK